jgi:hypothetical protein
MVEVGKHEKCVPQTAYFSSATQTRPFPFHPERKTHEYIDLNEEENLLISGQ